MPFRWRTSILSLMLLAYSVIIVYVFLFTFNPNETSSQVIMDITSTLLQVDGILLGFLGILIATLFTRPESVQKRVLEYEVTAGVLCVAAIFVGIIALLAPTSKPIWSGVTGALASQVLFTFFAAALLILGLESTIPKK